MTATILLIQPPIEDFYLTKKRTIPYGLISIAGHLMRAGFSVRLLDALATSKSRVIELPKAMDYLHPYYDREDRTPFALFHHYRHYGYSFQHIARVVKDCAPFLVGISSLFTPYAASALMTAEIVKKMLPECTVVMGGHHATAMPAGAMACKAVDFVLRGEGEASMTILAEALLNSSRDLKKIPGIVFRRSDGSLHISPPAFTDNLDNQALPAIELLNHSFYQRQGNASYVITGTRGCPLNCSYCSVGKHTGIPFRKRSIKSIIQEMKSAVRRFRVKFIDFEDENISFDRTWFIELLQAIIQNFGKNSFELRAMNGLFPPSLDDKTLSLMKDAGFRTLNLSLGTTSKHQLKRFNRPDVVSAFENAIELVEKYRLQAVGYIIVGAPYQDPLESVDDLLYLAQRRVLAGVSVYYPAPDSHDFEVCRSLGLLPAHASLFRSSALPLSHTTSRRDAVTLLRLPRLLNFMKAQIDQGAKTPPPLPFVRARIEAAGNESDIARTLLQNFLFDGKIRGVASGGHVYTHTISTELTHRFIHGLRRITVRGCM